MEPQIIRSKENATSSRSLTLIAAVLAIAALYFGRQVLIPLALGLVFAFLLSPLVTLLEKLRIGRAPAVFVALALALAVASSAGWVGVRQLATIVSEIPDYKYNLDLKIRSLRTSKDGNLSRATATVQELNRELVSASGQIASAQAQEKAPGSARHPLPVQVAAPPSNIFQDLRALLGPLAGVLETAAIVTIFTIFMLLKREDLRNRALRLAGRGQITVMTQAIDDAGRRLSRYLLMQFLVNAGYGLLFGTGLYFAGVPHAFLWGVLTALLRFVPYVGVLAATTLPILMALAVFPGWRQAGIAFGIFIALEVIVGNFVEPLLYGGNTGISSLAILVAAVFWTMLWGPVGLILSTPLTVCLIVLGRYVPQLNFLEILLGNEPVLSLEQCFYQRLLAMDQNEARTVAESFLRENSLESLYEKIFLPALKLAEQDHYHHAIDRDTRMFLLESMKEFIEDMGEHLDDPSDSAGSDDSESSQGQGAPKLRIACVPARSGPDETIVLMLTQLLEQAGYQAQVLSASSLEGMVAGISGHDYDLVCASSISSSGVSQARSLCKRLKKNLPRAQVILGLWNLEGGSTAAKESLGPDCPFAFTSTIPDTLAKIRQMTEPSYVSPSESEPLLEPRES